MGVSILETGAATESRLGLDQMGERRGKVSVAQMWATQIPLAFAGAPSAAF